MAIGNHANASFPAGFDSQLKFFRDRRERINGGYN
jgi:hypothetical protein